MRTLHASAPLAGVPDVPRAAAAEPRAHAGAEPAAVPELPAWTSRLPLVFGAWTLVALMTSTQSYVALHAAGRDQPYLTLLRGSLLSCWLWALYTIPIAVAARRTPLIRQPAPGQDRGGWPLAVLVHLGFLAALTLLDGVVMSALQPWFEPGRPPRTFLSAFMAFLFVNTICYFLIAFAVNAADYARLSRARQAEAAALSEQLARAQLDALRAQLRPHFLFNTLNTIAEQLHTDPRGADRMITRLATLLRATFEQPEAHEVPLARELETLRAYLEIMLVRFGDRLVVEVDPAADTLDAPVPPLLLQPIVENAIRHGVEPAERGGRVEVRAWRDGGWLVLEVLDDGVGLPAADAAGAAAGGGGVGLANTRARLRRLYGERHQLTLAPRPGGGTAVTVALPLPEARDDARRDARAATWPGAR
jgi:signal transduction histidine kinase